MNLYLRAFDVSLALRPKSCPGVHFAIWRCERISQNDQRRAEGKVAPCTGHRRLCNQAAASGGKPKFGTCSAYCFAQGRMTLLCMSLKGYGNGSNIGPSALMTHACSRNG